MKILYFYQYFSTPKGAWGTRVYEMAKRWVDQGHEVTVVTSIYYKSDLKASKMVEDQVFDGISVKVLNIEINNKQPVWKRVWTFMAYSVLSSWYAVRTPADVVVASSGPITVGIPGLVASVFRGRKLVFEVRDLWPDGAIEMGVLSNRFVIWCAYLFEKLCYRKASLVVALSPGMTEDISSRYESANLLSVPNAADNELFGASLPNFRLPDRFVGKKIANYVGNIGRVNNTELLLGAAKVLKGRCRDDIVIVIIGDGQQRGSIENEIRTNQLETIEILDLMPKEEMVGWVQSSFCSLVPLWPTPVLDTSSPNKFFDSLAAGVPVLQTTRGWLHELIERNECGITVDAESPESLADSLELLANDQELCARMGENAKKVAMTQFDRDALAKEMLSGIEKAVEN